MELCFAGSPVRVRGARKSAGRTRRLASRRQLERRCGYYALYRNTWYLPHLAAKNSASWWRITNFDLASDTSDFAARSGFYGPLAEQHRPPKTLSTSFTI